MSEKILVVDEEDGALIIRRKRVQDLEDFAVPTDEQTEEAITAWLDAHPEATTTVPDGSLTADKFSDALKLRTFNDYATPEMFGAYGDGVHDDTSAVQNALDAGGVILCAQNYKITGPVFISSGSYVQINRLTYTGNDSAIWLDNVQNCVLQLGEIEANNGTAIRVEVTGLRGETIRNNTNIRIFGGHIRAHIGIDMVSDPEVQHGNGYNGVAGNQEIAFYGTNITVHKIGSENNVEQGIGVRLDGISWYDSEADKTLKGWNGEINFFGGAIRRYHDTDWPTAFQTEGYNTGLYLSSVSVESCDVYFDLSGSVQKFYAINCRDERRENPEHYKNLPYTGQDGVPSLYPIKIHDITELSKFYFISDRFVPEDFDISNVGMRVSIRISGIIAQRGVPDQLDGFRYYSGTGWSQDPTVYASVRYTSAIASGLIQRSGTGGDQYEGAYLPVFGYKLSAATTNHVNIPMADVNLIRARGLPVYMYICAGCVLSIGSDAQTPDVFNIPEDSYIMLLPQGDGSNTDITLAGRQILHGLVPVRISSLDQDTEFKDLSLVTAMEGPSNQVTITETAARRIRSLIVDAKTIQSGSGDPSPSNIRPITPLSEVKIVVSPTTHAADGREYSVSISGIAGEIGGGTLDAAKGILLTQTYAYQILDGTETWRSYGTSYFGTESSEETKTQYAAGTGFCSHFKWALAQASSPAYTMCTYNADQYFPKGRIVLKAPDNITTVADFKSWLAAQAAGGTPVQVVYKLKNPVDVSEDFTPAQISSLYGTNYIWSDSGPVTVSRAIPIEDYIGQKIPDSPSSDGTYVLKATVSGGAVTYAWTAES